MSEGLVRRPAVAGQFYSSDPAQLGQEVRALLGAPEATEPFVALVVPHAGYVYSGGVAGKTYARARIPERVVVLGVNHRGRGSRFAGWFAGEWLTPLGAVPVDGEMAVAIGRHTALLEHDPAAHAGEHSLEVQLPFLQLAARGKLRVTPIAIASHDGDDLAELGRAVAAAVTAAGEPVLLVASTDLTHYEDAAAARRQDRLAIDRILDVDGPGLLRVVLERRISMCGVAPTTAALVAARELGARQAELVGYATSGDVTGDDSSVVGYAGLRVH